MKLSNKFIAFIFCRFERLTQRLKEHLEKVFVEELKRQTKKEVHLDYCPECGMAQIIIHDMSFEQCHEIERTLRDKYVWSYKVFECIWPDDDSIFNVDDAGTSFEKSDLVS